MKTSITGPYIGCTGFTMPDEVYDALLMYPIDHSHKLMVGIEVTWKSLRGIPLKPMWAKQTPEPEAIKSLMIDDERVINLAHYSIGGGQESTILYDMLHIQRLAGENFHGFQFNMPWPDIDQLRLYRKNVGWEQRIVLQLGKKAIEQAGDTPQGVIDMLYPYIGVVDDVLFDLSGGHGKPLEAERAFKFLSAIAKEYHLGLGVAGGLGPYSLGTVEPLIKRFKNNLGIDLSIDAQRELRDEEYNMVGRRVSVYLTEAPKLFV